MKIKLRQLFVMLIMQSKVSKARFMGLYNKQVFLKKKQLTSQNLSNMLKYRWRDFFWVQF